MARLVSAFLLLDISRSHLASLGVVWIHSQLTLLLTDGTEFISAHSSSKSNCCGLSRTLTTLFDLLDPTYKDRPGLLLLGILA